jgi:hypothetical protein
MPSRPVTLGIVIFWLAVTGWMVYRDLWQTAGEPPSFTLDLTDEVGAQVVAWEVEHNGRTVGSAVTGVRRRPDRVFELYCTFKPQDFRFRGLTVREVAGIYRINPKGALRRLECGATLELFWGLERKAEIEGEVAGGALRPLLWRGRDRQAPGRGGESQALPAVEVAANGKALNVLHPVHRLPRLYEGRAWRVPLVDPLVAAAPPAPQGQTPLVRIADARVSPAPLAWHGEEVVCWRVEYQEGGRAAMRTWVRADDGTVLRQEVLYPDGEIVLRRRVFK